ncbi:MAG TPA: phosphoglycerate dehydrogenase [Bacillota bacterium]|nr:phosphoglycerate dehydrogenase [Bacillota bacterium]
MRYKVLITAPYMQQELEKFLDFFKQNDIEIHVPEIIERMNEKGLLEIIEGFDGVISGDDQFTERVFDKAKNLRVISKWGTGINSIDLEAAKKYGVKIYNTLNAFSHPVSDTAMGMILCFSRNIIASDKALKDGKWKKIRGKSLSEQTLGIIGMGNVGTQLAKRANAFNMNILANDIKEIPSVILEKYNVTMVTKEEIYNSCDFISLNCDLNSTNYHMLNKDTFSLMINKPVIINTARGGLIKETDLIEALREGKVAGAGLDVYEEEPLPADSPLRNMDNCILSSHNSNSSPKYWEYVHANTLKNLLKGLKGE